MMNFKSIALAFIFIFSSFSVMATENSTETPAAAAPVASTPEDQIPLRMVSSEKASANDSNGQKIILTFGVLAALVGVGYYLFKRQSFMNKAGATNMMQVKVLSQHYLGPKKSLAIIRVAGESMLIGITDQNINMIKSLSLLDDELPTVVPEDFEKALQNGSETSHQDMIQNSSQNSNENAEDEFAFSGIKTTVFQKIKSMRNIQ